MMYRKRGVTDRWENGTLLHVEESGFASELDELFECHPLDCGSEAAAFESGGSAAALQTVAENLAAHIPPGVAIERLILTRGIAEHECGGRTWRDETTRLHISLTRDGVRALLDLANFDRAHIQRVAESLMRLTGEREPPPRLRLAPHVTAALIPTLIGCAPPNVRVVQTAGGVDGKGLPIEEASGPWPNWYRPSYRVRPVRMPMNVRLDCDVTAIDEERPVGVALLAPVSGLTFRVLVDDGRVAWPATVRVSRIDAVSTERIWYPYGAGSFGAEMML